MAAVVLLLVSSTGIGKPSMSTTRPSRLSLVEHLLAQNAPRAAAHFYWEDEALRDELRATSPERAAQLDAMLRQAEPSAALPAADGTSALFVAPVELVRLVDDAPSVSAFARCVHERVAQSDAAQGRSADEHGGPLTWMVALDAEWQPDLSVGSNNPPSLLQLASDEAIWLIDLQTLLRPRPPAAIRDAAATADKVVAAAATGAVGAEERAAQQGVALDHASSVEAELLGALGLLLTSPSVCILGFSFQSDLDKLYNAFGGWGSAGGSLDSDGASAEAVGCFARVHGVVDLRDACESARLSAGLAMLGVGGGAQRVAARASNSLVAQLEAWCGVRLDKSEQCSDWARRPLSPSQLAYAANDAACLLTLYRALQARTKTLTTVLTARTFIASAGARRARGKAGAAEAAEAAVNGLVEGLRAAALDGEAVAARAAETRLDGSGDGGLEVEGGASNGERAAGANALLAAAAGALGGASPGAAHGLAARNLAAVRAAVERATAAGSGARCTLVPSAAVSRAVAAADERAGGPQFSAWAEVNSLCFLCYRPPPANPLPPVRPKPKPTRPAAAKPGQPRQPPLQPLPQPHSPPQPRPPQPPSTPSLERLLVLAPAAERVDVRWLSNALGVPRRSIRLASASECRELFGAEPGAVPPLPLRAGVQVLAYASLRDHRAGKGGGVADASAAGGSNAGAEGQTGEEAGAGELHLSDATAAGRGGQRGRNDIWPGIAEGGSGSVLWASSGHPDFFLVIEQAHVSLPALTRCAMVDEQPAAAAETPQTPQTGIGGEGGGEEGTMRDGEGGARTAAPAAAASNPPAAQPVAAPRSAPAPPRFAWLPEQHLSSLSLDELIIGCRFFYADSPSAFALARAFAGPQFNSGTRAMPAAAVEDDGAGASSRAPVGGRAAQPFAAIGASVPAVARRPLVVTADCSLSKVARMLRLVGVDAAVAGEFVRPELSGCRGLARVKVDASLAEPDFRRAAVQGRVLLCSSRRAAEALPGTAYHLLATDPDNQFAELLEVFGLREAVDAGESRCGICNADSWRHLQPSEVQGRVPVGVLRETDEFYQCASCEQIFWPGPKYSNTMDSLRAAVSSELPADATTAGGVLADVVATRGGEAAAIKRLTSCQMSATPFSETAAQRTRLRDSSSPG